MIFPRDKRISAGRFGTATKNLRGKFSPGRILPAVLLVGWVLTGVGCRTPGRVETSGAPEIQSPAAAVAGVLPTTVAAPAPGTASAGGIASPASRSSQPGTVILPRPLPEPIPRRTPAAVVPVANRSGSARPSDSQSWDRLVPEARVHQTDEVWIFSAKGAPEAVRRDASLYEDSIALSRLRGELKKMPELPASVRTSARVRHGVGILQIPSGTPRTETARAVQRLLALPEIREIRLREEPSPTNPG